MTYDRKAATAIARFFQNVFGSKLLPPLSTCNSTQKSGPDKVERTVNLGHVQVGLLASLRKGGQVRTM